MNFTRCGCGISFKASGLRCHQRQSLDIRCQCQTEGPQFDDCDNSDNSDNSDCDMSENMDIDPGSFIADFIKDTTSSTGAEYSEFEVDPAGDLFGDYEDYISEEFGMDYLDSNVSDDESEGAIDEEEFMLTNDSEILEPERLPPSTSLPVLSCHGPLPDKFHSDQTDSESTTKTIKMASCLRGGAEEVLQKQPFVVKFTKGRAGETYANQCANGDNSNASYTRKVQAANAENPYSPFSSKLEWEIAHWAKMRGPSSTAFNELIEIEGVSTIQVSCQVAHTLS